jgi:ADP-heptose:LPS heptosyltransferase
MEPYIDRENIKKILVVRNDNIGDLILTTPALEALRLSFPDAFLAVLVADYTKEAVEGNPHIDKVYSYEKAKHSKSNKLMAWLRQWRVLREIRAEHFDVALGIRSSFSTSQGWLVYMSGAEVRIGHRPKKKGSIKDGYYNVFVEDPPKGWWPASYYIDIANALMDRADVEVVLNWMPSDEAYAREVIDGLKKKPVTFVSTGVKSFAAFLSLSDLFITLEGGAMHVGGAAGVEMIAVFGRTPIEEWAPLGTGQEIVLLQNGYYAAQVTPEDVIEASVRLISK